MRWSPGSRRVNNMLGPNYLWLLLVGGSLLCCITLAGGMSSRWFIKRRLDLYKVLPRSGDMLILSSRWGLWRWSGN